MTIFTHNYLVFRNHVCYCVRHTYIGNVVTIVTHNYIVLLYLPSELRLLLCSHISILETALTLLHTTTLCYLPSGLRLLLCSHISILETALTLLHTTILCYYICLRNYVCYCVLTSVYWERHEQCYAQPACVICLRNCVCIVTVCRRKYTGHNWLVLFELFAFGITFVTVVSHQYRLLETA